MSQLSQTHCRLSILHLELQYWGGLRPLIYFGTTPRGANMALVRPLKAIRTQDWQVGWKVPWLQSPKASV